MKRTKIINGITVSTDATTNTRKMGRYVYLITFPDNSIFIGKTDANIEKVMLNNCLYYQGYNTRKNNAIREQKAFEIEILRECEGEWEMKYYEWYYIQAYAKAIFNELMPDTEYSSVFKDMVKFQLLNDKNL